MKNTLLIAGAAAVFVAYMLWRKKYADPEKYLRYKAMGK